MWPGASVGVADVSPRQTLLVRGTRPAWKPAGKPAGVSGSVGGRVCPVLRTLLEVGAPRSGDQPGAALEERQSPKSGRTGGAKSPATRVAGSTNQPFAAPSLEKPPGFATIGLASAGTWTFEI